MPELSHDAVPDTATLCARYRETGDARLRELLVLQHIHLVKWAVDRVACAGTTPADREDLISEGVLGLIDAIDRYDAKRGILLSTYATFRIRGQIADALRARDLLPRSARRRVRQLQDAVSRFTAGNGHLPDEDDLAALLQAPVDDVRRTLLDASLEIHSLDAPRGPDDEGLSLLTTLRAPTGTEPDARHDEEELQAELHKALLELPERQRLLLSLYYVEELTMKEIGQVLGVSESRVSQLHAQAVMSLRALLERAGYAPRSRRRDGSSPPEAATECAAAAPSEPEGALATEHQGEERWTRT